MFLFHPNLRVLKNFILAGSLLAGWSLSGQTWRNLPQEWKLSAGDFEDCQNLTFDDSQWKTVDLAKAARGQGDLDKVVWCRLHLKVPADCQRQDLILHLGKLGNPATTFFNGVRIITGFGAREETVFIVPDVLVKSGGENVIAIKITSPAGEIGNGEFDWAVLSSVAESLAAQGFKKSAVLEKRCAAAGPGAADFILQGVRSADFTAFEKELKSAPSPAVSWQAATRWNELCEIEKNLPRYLQNYESYRSGDRLDLMKNSATYLVRDFHDADPHKPVMGCEFSDFGSWYDLAYCGGLNRFIIGSVRKGVGPDYEFFNTPRDLGVLALFLKDASGNVIDGGNGAVSGGARPPTSRLASTLAPPNCAVTWYPYGWRTVTRDNQLEAESAVFFTAFNTIAVYASVKNLGTQDTQVTPGLLVTMRSEYDGQTGGHVTGSVNSNNIVQIRNVRVGAKTGPELYDDTLKIGSTLGTLKADFVPHYLPGAREGEWQSVLNVTPSSSLASASGSVILTAAEAAKLKPGEDVVFVFVIAATPGKTPADERCAAIVKQFAAAPKSASDQTESAWNNFLVGLPKLDHPGYATTKLYYSAVAALRKNHILREQNGRLYDASYPARGGFNYFFQSDSCWNLLGYLDFMPEWAKGHAVPILDPPCKIMDPHFFWSMWELYSRLPDPKERRDFAVAVYPLLTNAYHVWTTTLDINSNLLVATPNNWDDNPRYDLIFKEIKYEPGWNSWWNDLVTNCYQNKLEDPAPSSQLGYGAVVLGRLAKILGHDQDAAYWAEQYQRHCRAIDTLWDEQRGYWIVTYRDNLKDDVLTSSVLYPVFTDLCRDPAKIKRVIEQHVLNPAEFNGHFPVPTIAYDDPRYYHDKPPFQDKSPAGLWRGNLWMPEAWVIVKGLYKYGYEAEANDMVGRLLDMMSHQAASVGEFQQFAYSPAEWYNSENGLGQNNRAFSWSSAVALDFLLGNYQNERVVGTNPERDRRIEGHVREIFDFNSQNSLFRVEPIKTAFPVLKMATADGLPINQSKKVEFSFSDPAGNFGHAEIPFTFDESRWKVVDASAGHDLTKAEDGFYRALIGGNTILIPRNVESASRAESE